MTDTAQHPIVHSFEELVATPVAALQHHANRRPIAHRAGPARARHRYAHIPARRPLLPRVQRALRVATYLLFGLCILAEVLPGTPRVGVLAGLTLAVWLTTTVLHRPLLRRTLIRWYLVQRSGRA